MPRALLGPYWGGPESTPQVKVEVQPPHLGAGELRGVIHAPELLCGIRLRPPSMRLSPKLRPAWLPLLLCPASSTPLLTSLGITSFNNHLHTSPCPRVQPETPSLPWGGHRLVRRQASFTRSQKDTFLYKWRSAL